MDETLDKLDEYKELIDELKRHKRPRKKKKRQVGDYNEILGKALLLFLSTTIEIKLRIKILKTKKRVLLL